MLNATGLSQDNPTSETDGLSQDNPTSDGLPQDNSTAEVVRLGQEAMARQRRGFDDWLAIGEALQFGRAQVMREAHTNEPRGSKYEKAMAEWLVANGFKEIDKGARSRLLECLEHRAEIEEWRRRLTAADRLRYNHPSAVLRKWKASTVAPNPSAPTKVSPYAKLQAELAEALERLHRAEQEIARGGGDLWGARDIAQAMRAKLRSASQAEAVARELMRIAKAEEAQAEQAESDLPGEAARDAAAA
jgi:hypothetical protein